MATTIVTTPTKQERLDEAQVKIESAIALGEVLAQIGDVAEDQIPYMRTTAFVIVDLLRDADSLLSGARA